jgi:hypothetical protein
MDAQHSLVYRVEYTPYNANTLSYGNIAYSCMLISKRLLLFSKIRHYIGKFWYRVVCKNSGVCTMFILKGKALCKLMFKAICVLETCALIQEAYLYGCKMSIVIIVRGDGGWMME